MIKEIKQGEKGEGGRGIGITVVAFFNLYFQSPSKTTFFIAPNEVNVRSWIRQTKKWGTLEAPVILLSQLSRTAGVPSYGSHILYPKSITVEVHEWKTSWILLTPEFGDVMFET